MNSFHAFHRTLMLGTTAIGLLAASGAAARVGVTSAIDGDPLGKPPAENERVLRIGLDVQANELITTRANDRAHLMFLDGTSVTVGPNAQLTIDRFVYDPNRKSGDLAITATKGVLRLVGGKISKSNPVIINTPSAIIGIRGGITILDVQPNSTKSTFVFGNNMMVRSGGQVQNVTRAGSTVTTSVGKAPSAPVLAKAADLGAQMGQLEGTGGQGSGKAEGNTAASGNADSKAASSGLSGSNSNANPAALQAGGTQTPPVSAAQRLNNSNTVTSALSNVQTEQQPTETQKTSSPGQAQASVIVTRGRFRIEPAYTGFNSATLGVTHIPGSNGYLAPTGNVTNNTATITLGDGRTFSVPWNPGEGVTTFSINHPTLGVLSGRGIVSAAGDFFAYSFVDASNKTLGFIGGTPTTLAQFPTSGIATHTIVNNSQTSSGALAFAPGAIASDAAYKAAAVQGPMYSVYTPRVGMDVGTPTGGAVSSNSMQSTISISGSGASQKSYIGMFVGEYFKDYNNETMFNSGAYTASYRTSANDRIGRATSVIATFDVPGGNSIFGPNADTMAFGPSPVSSANTQSGGIITSGTTTRSAAVSYDQPYTGLVGTDYYSSNYATKTATPSTVGTSRTTREMNGYVGGIVEQRSASPANVPGSFTTRTIGGAGAVPTDIVIKTDSTSNRFEAVLTVQQFDGPSTSATFQIGGQNIGRIGRSSFVDDNIYAARDRAFSAGGPATTTIGGSTGANVTSRTFLVSYGAAPVANFFAEQGVTPCTCDFMTWGWWSGDIAYGSGSAYNPNGRDRLNLATYVAGTLSNVADLNTLNTMGATATYTGHMVGNVQNGTSSYVAAGTYTNAWSFGPRTGNASVTFDGANYSGVTAQSNAAINAFSTVSPLSSTGIAGRSMTINGSFVSSPTDPAKGQMGNFTVNGAAYKAGGTFAAQKP